eukprot:scaffold15947_cov140-Skeletonema_menzelii.AAC.2
MILHHTLSQDEENQISQQLNAHLSVGIHTTFAGFANPHQNKLLNHVNKVSKTSTTSSPAMNEE